MFYENLLAKVSRVWKLSGLEYDPVLLAMVAVAASAVIGFVSAAIYCLSGQFLLSIEAFAFVPLCVLGLTAGVIGGLAVYRQYKFAAQLPSALEIIVSIMQTGTPVPQAIAEVAPTLPMPMRKEFERVVEKLREGVPASEAIRTMYETVHIPQIHELSDAVSVGMSAGGQVSRQVAVVAKELRDKEKERSTMQKSLGTVTLLGGIALIWLVLFFLSVAFVPFIGGPFLESMTTRLFIVAVYAVIITVVLKAKNIQALLNSLPQTGAGAKVDNWMTQEKLKNETPKFLDNVAMTVETGLSLPAAVQKVRQSPSSFPTLARELDLQLVDQSSYLSSIPSALRTIGNQYGVSELLSAAAAIEASTRSGAGISTQLRNQSEALRNRLASDRQGRASSMGPTAIVVGLVIFAVCSLISIIFH